MTAPSHYDNVAAERKNEMGKILKTIKSEDIFFTTTREEFAEAECDSVRTTVRKIVVYTLDGKKVCEGIPYKYPMFHGRRLWYQNRFMTVNYAAQNKGVQKYILDCIKRYNEDEVAVANIYCEVMKAIENACHPFSVKDFYCISVKLSSIIMGWDNERLKNSFEKRRKWIEAKANGRNAVKYHPCDRVVKERKME